MRKLMLGLAGAGLLILPVPAMAATYDPGDTRAGAFVGARLQMRLGGRSAPTPRASLAIAPTVERVSNRGELRSSIGEGLALSFTPRTQPTLTIIGVPAEKAFRPNGGIDSERKMGLSTGAWIGIGVVTAAAVGFLYLVNEAEENTD